MRAPRLAIALAALLTACGSAPDPEAAPAPVERLIEEDPRAIFDARMLREPEGAFRWTFQEARQRDAWTAKGGSIEAAPNGDLLVFWTGRGLQLGRSVDLAAGDLHAIDVVLRGESPTPIGIAWRGNGEEAFVPERSALLREGTPGGGGTLRYRFALADLRTWSGRITELRVVLVAPGPRRAALVEVVGLTAPLSPPALSELAARPLKVTLGAELRSARIAPAGAPIRWAVDVPEAAELRMAIGVAPAAPAPVRFLVEWEAAGETRVVLDRTLPATSAPDAHWHEVAVDLPEAGPGVFHLRAEMPKGFGSAAAVPCFANPEIRSRRGNPRSPDIVLIVIDTLRADRMSLYGSARKTTPAIDAWAGSHGVVFEQAIAPSPWTLPSHASLFSGLLAERHGANHPRPLPPDLPLLAEQLRRDGYATRAITGGGYVHPRWGFHRGFDTYRFMGAWLGGYATELDDSLATARAWLEETAPAPLFLFFHTYEVHEPFTARQPHFERYSGRERSPSIYSAEVPARADNGWREQRRFVMVRGNGPPHPLPETLDSLPRDLYDSGLAYADERIGQLLAAVEARGRPAIAVLTSDHGEMLGEHGLSDHTSLHDEVLHVPLVIAAPGVRPRRVAEQVRLVDVAPTILDLVGLAPQKRADGASLRPFLEGRAGEPREAWSYAGRTNFGLSLRPPSGGQYVYEDAAWERDGGEEIRGREAASDASLRRRAQEHLEESLPGLRIRVTNDGAEPITGRFAGILRGPGALKTTLGACRCARWEPPDSASFRLPPGEAVTFAALDIDAGARLRLALDAPPDGTPFEVEIPLGGLDEPRHFALDGGTWREVPTEDAPARVTLWWKGAHPTAGRDPADDPALRESLRALGYVE